jgi:hypothetical protein
VNPEILSRSDLNAFEKLLWHWLAECSQPIATAAIAEALCQNVWSVRRAVKNMQEKGLITASKIAPSASRFAPSMCKIAPSASENARSASKNAPGTSRIAPGKSHDLNGKGEGKPHARALHGAIDSHSITRSHSYMSHIHGDSHVHVPKRRPNPTHTAEQKEAAKIGSILDEIMAKIPSPQQQKRAIATKVHDWINDSDCHTSIAARVAEAIVLEKISETEFAKIVTKINAIDKKHGVKNRGAMFLTEIKKLWQKHGMKF